MPERLWNAEIAQGGTGGERAAQQAGPRGGVAAEKPQAAGEVDARDQEPGEQRAGQAHRFGFTEDVQDPAFDDLASGAADHAVFAGAGPEALALQLGEIGAGREADRGGIGCPFENLPAGQGSIGARTGLADHLWHQQCHCSTGLEAVGRTETTYLCDNVGLFLAQPVGGAQLAAERAPREAEQDLVQRRVFAVVAPRLEDLLAFQGLGPLRRILDAHEPVLVDLTVREVERLVAHEAHVVGRDHDGDAGQTEQDGDQAVEAASGWRGGSRAHSASSSASASSPSRLGSKWYLRAKRRKCLRSTSASRAACDRLPECRANRLAR